MKKVSELLNKKGQEVWSIDPDASVYEAIRMMAEKEVGALLVVKDNELVGIISERDYARQIILKERSSKTTKTNEIMTKRVVYTQPEKKVDECMALMTEKRVRHLPVMDGNKIVGVISVGDLVKSIISEQQWTIDQLEHYITG